MYKWQKVYCRLPKGNRTFVRVSWIYKIEDGIAYLWNHKRFYIETGLECNDEEDILWQPLTPEVRQEYANQKKAKEFRKWFRKILEMDDMVITLYRQIQNKTTIDLRKYIQNISFYERQALMPNTIGFLKANYRQPYWCGHQHAFDGPFGCRQLLTGKKVTENTCLTCEYYVRDKQYDFYRRLRLLAGVSQQQVGSFLGCNDYGKIETGERRPTDIELSRLQYLFSTEEWTVEQVKYFWETIDHQGSKVTDPFYKKFGDIIQSKLLLNNVIYENSNTKNW